MKITKNELTVLVAIRDSEYQDGATGTAAVVGNPIWTNVLWAFDGKGKSLGGLLTSLQRKSLVIVGNAPGEETVALTESGLAAVPFGEPNTEPTIAAETASEPKETTAPATLASVRPQTEKLRALNLAMCGKGRLFGAKGSCKCCGASLVPAIAPPAKNARPRKPKSSVPTTSDVTRAKNADAKVARIARRAGIALASVGSGS